MIAYLLDFMSNKLSLSRLQRDLTDAPFLEIRNYFGHITAISGIRTGLSKININPIKIHDDLDSHIEVITEGFKHYFVERVF